MSPRAPARARVPGPTRTAAPAAPIVQRSAAVVAPPQAATEDLGAARERAERLGHRLDRIAPGALPDVPVAPPGSGRPLPAGLRERMEAALGADLGGVRLHEGPEASRVGAIAYTRGENIHFALGRLSPGSPTGQRLLGHELTHVLQQRTGRVATPPGPGAPINADAALEAEADRLGTQAARGESAAPGAAPAAASASAPVQRKVDAPMQLEDEDAPQQGGGTALLERPKGQAQATDSADTAATALSGISTGGNLAGQAVSGFSKLGDSARGVASGGLLGAATGTFGGVSDMVGGIKGLSQAVKAGHVRKGLETSARTATGIGNVGLAASQMAEYGSKLSGAAGVTSTVVGKVLPGFNIALGGLDVVQGGAQGIRAGMARNNLNDRMKTLREAGGDNGGLLDSLQFMHGVQGKVAKRGAINAVSGALNVAGGAAMLSGAGAPVGAALAGIGTGIKVGRSIFGDLKQWMRDKAADDPKSMGGRFANFFGADKNQSSKRKAEQMDTHVDRLVGQHDSEHVHAALDDMGMSKGDLEKFKNYKGLKQEDQSEMWGRIKALHMKRQGGDPESFERGKWRQNLFSDTIPNAGKAIASGASRVGSAIASGARSAGSWLANTRAGKAIGSAASTVGGAIASGASRAGSAIVSGASSLGGMIASGASRAGSAIASGASSLGGMIAGGARTAGSAIANSWLGQKVGSAGSAIANSWLGRKLGSAGSAIASGARSLGGTIAGGARTAGTAIASGASTAASALGRGADWAGDMALRGAGHLGSAVASGARTAGSAIASGAGWLWNKIKGVGSAIHDKIRGPAAPEHEQAPAIELGQMHPEHELAGAAA